MTNKEYFDMTKKASPGSKSVKNCLNAFWVGGLICLLGQLLLDLYENVLKMEQNPASTLVSMSLITISIILTALGLYQKIAKFAGAGTLVPITGFANAMSSPAIEFKPEGHVLGIGTNLFSIAGPVIVFGIIASVAYGIVIFIVKIF